MNYTNQTKESLFHNLFIDPSSSNKGNESSNVSNNTKTADVDNWNSRFQSIISLPEATRDEKLIKYSSLNGLNRDFIATASVYAKTIISEYFLSDELKSVKTRDIGGYAGGKKFLWRGILFKLAYGDQGPYRGNDEAAAKAMGHELKGGNSYFRCCNGNDNNDHNDRVGGDRSDSHSSQLHVALQALIDYKGFRMHAQAELPIDGRCTLLMGTADASHNVFAESGELTVLMKKAAKELNLREHYVKNKLLYAACDIEGHFGYDKKYYVVDLARTFPPESPDLAPHLWTQKEKSRSSQDDNKSGVSPERGEVSSVQQIEESRPPMEVVIGEVVSLYLDSSGNEGVENGTMVVRCGEVLEVEAGYVTVLLMPLETSEMSSGGGDVSGDQEGVSSGGFVDVNWEDPSVCFGEELSADCLNFSSISGDDEKAKVPEIVTVAISALISESVSGSDSTDMGVKDSSSNRQVETVTRRDDVEEELTVTSSDGMSIFWRLLRPEFVKHRGSQLLGDHAVAGKRVTESRTKEINHHYNELKVEDDVCFEWGRSLNYLPGGDEEQDDEFLSGRVVDIARGSSVVSALSCGYSDGSFMHDKELPLDIELLQTAGMPTHRPALTQVFSLPTQLTSNGVSLETNNRYNIPSGNSDITFSTSSHLTDHSYDPGTLYDTSYPDPFYFVEKVSSVPEPQRPLDNTPSKRAMDLFFPMYTCGDVLNSNNDSNGVPLVGVLQDNAKEKAATRSSVKEGKLKTRSEKKNKKKQFEVEEEHLDDESVESQSTSLTQQSEHTTVSLFLPSLRVIEQHMDIEQSQHLRLPLPPVPLSPDALSAFGRTDPLYKECDDDVREATALLVEQLIPAMAVDLQTKGHPMRREGLSITEYMHRHGVNIRHMGLLRWHLLQLQQSGFQDNDNKHLSNVGDVIQNNYSKNDDETVTSNMDDSKTNNFENDLSYIQAELLLECISRTLKNLLRQTQRQWMCNMRTSSEEGMITLVVNFLNLITASHPTAASFWSVLVIPGIYERFGKVAVTSEESLPAGFSSTMDKNGINNEDRQNQLPMLFTEQCSDADIRVLVHRVCARGGIQLHPECLEHLEEGTAKGFEFAVSDVIDLIPVVKHMHQVDLGEGLMLSLMGQDADAGGTMNSTAVCPSSRSRATTPVTQSQSVRMRLMTLSVDKLHAALKAVPDDSITKQALADAYQSLAFASLADSNSILDTAVNTNDCMEPNELNTSDDKNNTTSKSNTLTKNRLHQSSSVYLKEKDKGKNRFQYITERGFELYRSLLWADEHTKCAKLGISHEDDTLGVCVLITHFKFDKYLSKGDGSRRSISERNQSQWDIQRIKDVKVGKECVSLKYFRMFVSYYMSMNKKKGKRNKRKQDDMERISCWRFFPLIVDPQHAHRAKDLLTYELILADRVHNRAYTYDHVIDSQQELSQCSDSRRRFSSASEVSLSDMTNSSDSEYHLPSSAINELLPKISPNITLRVISAVMNSMVLKFVDDAQSKGKISDSALVGFIRFHHMLLFLSKKSYEIKKEANKCVELFVRQPIHRTKEGTPDLGRFLVYVLLSDRGWDEEFRYAYLQETLRRQVAWFINQGSQKYSLLILEDDEVSLYRLQTTFQQTLKSLRSTMFQVYFLQTIARSGQASTTSDDTGLGVTSEPRSQDAATVVLHLYNASLGRPTAAMRNDYKTQFEEIMQISNYGQYLKRLGCCRSPRQFTSMLRNAIRSCTHRSYGGIPFSAMVGDTDIEIESVTKSNDWQWNDFEVYSLSSEDLLLKEQELFHQWYFKADTSIAKSNEKKKNIFGKQSLSGAERSQDRGKNFNHGYGKSEKNVPRGGEVSMNRKGGHHKSSGDSDDGKWGRNQSRVHSDVNGNEENRASAYKPQRDGKWSSKRHDLKTGPRDRPPQPPQEKHVNQRKNDRSQDGFQSQSGDSRRRGNNRDDLGERKVSGKDRIASSNQRGYAASGERRNGGSVKDHQSRDIPRERNGWGSSSSHNGARVTGGAKRGGPGGQNAVVTTKKVDDDGWQRVQGRRGGGGEG